MNLVEFEHIGITLGCLGIPVVVVALEGGFNSIDDIYESIQKKIPIVICDGSGRVADILANAYYLNK